MKPQRRQQHRNIHYAHKRQTRAGTVRGTVSHFTSPGLAVAPYRRTTAAELARTVAVGGGAVSFSKVAVLVPLQLTAITVRFQRNRVTMAKPENHQTPYSVWVSSVSTGTQNSKQLYRLSKTQKTLKTAVIPTAQGFRAVSPLQLIASRYGVTTVISQNPSNTIQRMGFVGFNGDTKQLTTIPPNCSAFVTVPVSASSGRLS